MNVKKKEKKLKKENNDTKNDYMSRFTSIGKSTWSKQYCIDHPEYMRVNKDDIREFFTGIPYSTQFEEYIINLERLYADAIINQKKSIIIDDSNFNPKYLNYWMQKARNEGLEVEIKTFDTPLEECISRDSKREKSVGKHAIEDMYKKYISKDSL